MTTEDQTFNASVSRRTVLRTTANAAWMVPAISLASAVPANAACSLTTDFNLVTGSLSAPTSPADSQGRRYRTQNYTVSNISSGVHSGAAGTASLLVKIEEEAKLIGLDILGSTSGWSISVPGWVAVGLQSGPAAGKKNSKYLFTRAFGCGESAAANVTFSWGSTLGLNTPPVISATVTP
jgi:hypothetical protein